MRKIIAIALVALSVIPAHAGGSMAYEVSIIHVQPTYEVQQQSRANVVRREMRAEAREAKSLERQANREALRDLERAAQESNKAYAKKLAAQRKARAK